MRQPQPARMPHKIQLALVCMQDVSGKSVGMGDGQKGVMPLEMPQCFSNPSKHSRELSTEARTKPRCDPDL